MYSRCNFVTYDCKFIFKQNYFDEVNSLFMKLMSRDIRLHFDISFHVGCWIYKDITFIT